MFSGADVVNVHPFVFAYGHGITRDPNNNSFGFDSTCIPLLALDVTPVVIKNILPSVFLFLDGILGLSFDRL